MLEPPVATSDGAARFLNDHLGRDVGDVELVGEGEWSRCFGFVDDGRELVIRFGRHLEDFERDQRAATFASPALPVPEVLEIGPAFDGWFAISSRVRGEPLETVDRAAWTSALPALQRALDALRAHDLSATTGFGAWDATGNAPYDSWQDFLLAVADDEPEHRSHHGDLLNRNVLIDGPRITGVFDWGCSIYGDPLYELALLQFWEPWHAGLDVAPLLDVAQGHDDRLRACLIHVGLQHQGYFAFLGRDDDLRRITEQTNALL